jgi:hypothetical protein
MGYSLRVHHRNSPRTLARPHDQFLYLTIFVSASNAVATIIGVDTKKRAGQHQESRRAGSVSQQSATTISLWLTGVAIPYI